jgi:hypothetical protein
MTDFCKLQPFEGGNGRYSFFVPKQARSTQALFVPFRAARLRYTRRTTGALQRSSLKSVKVSYSDTHS